jgi:ubiquinol-cytochrome c reductase cytochrome b/c1 subunit
MTMQRAILALMLVGALSAPALAQQHQVPPPARHWSFAGSFGKYDQAQLQRGFKVYREVCAACHSLNLVSFRNLAESGGPGFSEAQAAQIASEYKINDLDDSGQPVQRDGRPADRFPPPFPNDKAAQAANGGVAPPDMSTLAKARTYQRGFPWFIIDALPGFQYQEQGPDYIAALMQGYKEDPPQGFKLPPGGHYNEYFPGHAIVMPPPLSAGQVKYDDGAPETLEQYSNDIAAFLMWAAEPHMVARKRIGFQVMIYLIVLAGLLYFTKKKVWHEVEKPREIAHGQDPSKTSI